LHYRRVSFVATRDQAQKESRPCCAPQRPEHARCGQFKHDLLTRPSVADNTVRGDRGQDFLLVVLESL